MKTIRAGSNLHVPSIMNIISLANSVAQPRSRRGRPVKADSKRQQALRLAARLDAQGVPRKDILGLVADKLGLTPNTANTYVANYFSGTRAAVGDS